MYQSLEELIEDAENAGQPIWKIAADEDAREENISPEESFQRMKKMYLAMKSSDQQYDPTLKSRSGLVGTAADKITKRKQNNELLTGNFIGSVMERAVKIAESSACMRRIVAAPTAGSCGVGPAVLLSLQEKLQASDDTMTEALYVAAAIGGVIASRASLAGAEGGCQAEIGSASGMAAAAAVYLDGGTERQMASAMAIALSGMLGLVCDPVAGLVEVPCVKRNVIGAVNALTSADMALSGIESKIPPDEVIDAMKSIGHSMAMELRETGKGGLAGTPTGVRIRQAVSGGMHDKNA